MTECGPEREGARRRAMVEDQIAARGVRDPRVLDALRRVPRHEFVPEGVRADAYGDQALPIGLDRTISQPYIVGLMTEAARLRPGDRVLEVGTGSGYQAAVLSVVLGEAPGARGALWSIEIVEPLARRARATLDRLGYGAVRTRIGDGWKGWPEEAPFDAILVTAAPPTIPPELVDQLAAGGRLVIPVGPREETQSLVRLERCADGSLARTELCAVRFVPMVLDSEPRPVEDEPEEGRGGP